MIAGFPAPAANLVLDAAIERRLAAGESILHLGFGESRLPVFAGLREALARGAADNHYGPIEGRGGPREAFAGYLTRRGLPTTADQIVLGPGSKVLLFAMFAALPGDVVLARPSWLTYAAQAELLGRRVLGVPIAAEFGGVPDPDRLGEALLDHVAAGGRPGSLVVTSPDNPTGTTVPSEARRRVAEAVEAHGGTVIFDEIYGDVTFDPAARAAGLGDAVTESSVVVTGLSKSLSLGGWRIGAARFPDDESGRALRDRVVSFASQTWSSLAAPMQAVAEYAFSESPELVAYRERCTALHAGIAGAVHERLVRHGIACRVPTGGFYVYPDLGFRREALGAVGVVGSASLERWLLEQHGIAVLGGHHFGDDPDGLRFRVATSMLYGPDGAAQRMALDADRPETVPHVAEALDTIESLARSLSVL